jgi:hypothetical protein
MSRVRVKYEVTKSGPSGVGGVELWLKDKNGWSRASSVKDGEPLEVELPADGAYGLKVVPISGQGIRGAEPTKDSAADAWIVRDTVKPVITLKVTPTATSAAKDTKLPAGPARELPFPGMVEDAKPPAAPFVVEVTIRETNLDCQKTNFMWRDAKPGEKNAGNGPLFTGADLSKDKIETKIGVFVRRKSGAAEPGVFTAQFDWTPTPDVPAKVALSVEAVDRAGNKSSVTTEFGTDLTEPAAKVTSVQVVPMK